MAERNLPKPVAKGTRSSSTVGLDRKVKGIFSDVGQDIVQGTIIPGAENLLRQALHGIVDGLFGNRGRGYYSGYSSYSQPSYRSGYGRTDYSGYSRGRGQQDERYDDRYYNRGRRKNNVDMVYRTWGEAEDIKDALAEVVEANGRAYISDLNYLSDEDDRDHMDTEYGWVDISTAHIRTIRRFFPDGADGFALILPEPIYLGQ